MGGAAERTQRRAGVVLVGGLAVDDPVERHHRVHPQNRLAGGLAGARRLDGAGLAQGVGDRDLQRIALLDLGDAGHTDREGDPKALQDRLALRRSGREDQRSRAQASSPKNSAASRAADSGESEPWTMF